MKTFRISVSIFLVIISLSLILASCKRSIGVDNSDLGVNLMKTGEWSLLNTQIGNLVLPEQSLMDRCIAINSELEKLEAGGKLELSNLKAIGDIVLPPLVVENSSLKKTLDDMCSRAKIQYRELNDGVVIYPLSLNFGDYPSESSEDLFE